MRYYSMQLIILFITLNSCSKFGDEEKVEPIVVNTDNKFINITPSTETQTLTSMWFFSALSGNITTSSNKILNTYDGGITWGNSIINGSSYLENLYYKDSTLGFCTDPNFKSFKFINQNWTEFSFPITNTYASCFQILNENQIFATTVKGQNDVSYLVHSNNGGALWDTLFEYNANFKKVLMLDDKKGFILANGDEKIDIIKTSDAGKSWYSRLPSAFSNFFPGTTQLKEIIALDTNNLIAIGRGSASNQGFILTSVDGGDIWKMAITDHALTSLCATKTDVFFVGAELFATRWKINILALENPIEITDSWIPYNRETDFLISDKGEPVSHYHHIIKVQVVDDTAGFILTSDASKIFKIKLVP